MQPGFEPRLMTSKSLHLINYASVLPTSIWIRVTRKPQIPLGYIMRNLAQISREAVATLCLGRVREYLEH